jgi:hypothetical protein
MKHSDPAFRFLHQTFKMISLTNTDCFRVGFNEYNLEMTELFDELRANEYSIVMVNSIELES